jgi:hypothetical protein
MDCGYYILADSVINSDDPSNQIAFPQALNHLFESILRIARPRSEKDGNVLYGSYALSFGQGIE